MKNDAVVANPGLSSIASSNASLINPSQASVHSRLLEKPTIPAGVETQVDSTRDTTPTKLSSTQPEHTSSALTNLWKKATEALQNDPDPVKRDLVKHYAEILASELCEPRDSPEAQDPGHLKHEEVAESLNVKVEELSQERLTISIGSRELAIEPMFKNVSKHIVAARDLISSAAGAEPHAALACAGGLVILTVRSSPPICTK